LEESGTSDSELKLAPAISVVTSLSKRLYTVSELIRLSGLTRKKVGYWERIGLVTPTLRTPRLARSKPCIFYSASEVLKALVICELLRHKLSLQQVQQLARNLRELDVDLYDRETYLLTDGYSLYYAFSDNQVVDVHKHHRQMLLLVPLHEQVAKLQEVA
jgi:DNA-binding transcriptional MerR regulator